MSHRHVFFLCGIWALHGCASRSTPDTTPARVELRTSDYAREFVLPEGVELTLDCPSRFCVELRPTSGGLPMPDDAAQASEVLSRYMNDLLLPTFRERFGFAGGGEATACQGGARSCCTPPTSATSPSSSTPQRR